MFEPRIEPDWVNDEEWESTFFIQVCEEEVDAHPDGIECNGGCDPAYDNHMCGFGGDVPATYVGGRYGGTAYYTCPDCKTEYSSNFDGE